MRLPSRLTESAIAASIIVAALNNVFPVVTESRARIAFAFGLLHGFGFASVLADMGLPHGARLLSLLAFNLGIESGQLAVVLLVMPAVYCFRKAAVVPAHGTTLGVCRDCRIGSGMARAAGILSKLVRGAALWHTVQCGLPGGELLRQPHARMSRTRRWQPGDCHPGELTLQY